MKQAVIDGAPDKAEIAARDWLEIEGADPLSAVQRALTPAMDKVGQLYEAGEYFLPELVGAAEAMKAALSVLRPAIITGGGSADKGVIIMATVQGDIHEIGKTIVSTLLEARGYRVYDLGADVKTDRLCREIEELDPDLVGLSALLTTTMINQRRAIETIHGRGYRARVIVGGAPVSPAWAKEIGADGYGKNAFEATAMVENLLKIKVQ